MPVWHERTKEAREAGELTLIGITEEQHPDRCELFAQWQRSDWPILWDPFNLTESSAVPVAIGIDEHGVVRTVGMSVDQFDEFMTTNYDAIGDAETRRSTGVRKEARGPRVLDASAALTGSEALSRLLWSRGDSGALAASDLAACIRALELPATRGDDPSASFRLGVARRLRYDSPASVPEDFQASLDLWMAALRKDPSQYIWRRRIQQWGPRLDKPYPFYGWIEEATKEIRARGDKPVELRVSLTSSEVSGSDPVRVSEAQAEHPDPERKVPRDADRWVRIDVAVVPHTGDREQRSEARGSQVHLALRPSREMDVHWSNDAGPTQIWIDNAVESGLERPELTLPVPGELVSSEPRCADFTVASATGEVLRGTAFYFVCEGVDGQCRFLAQDFEVVVPTQ